MPAGRGNGDRDLQIADLPASRQKNPYDGRIRRQSFQPRHRQGKKRRITELQAFANRRETRLWKWLRGHETPRWYRGDQDDMIVVGDERRPLRITPIGLQLVELHLGDDDAERLFGWADPV
ncbi:hypothetical protein D3C71_1602310 [compost metagenome]